MRERGAGRIVNVSSTAGKRPSTGMPNYSVTKAAVLSLSRLVADVYAKDGILCNAVAPGPTASPAWLAAGGLADQSAERTGKSREEILEGVGKGRPLGPTRRAGGDRRGDRLSVLGPSQLCDRIGVERGRRNRPHHHLAFHMPELAGRIADAFEARIREQEETWLSPLAVRSYETRGRARPEEDMRPAHAVPARPRPHRPLEVLPAAEAQDPGLHRPEGDHYRTRLTHTLETAGSRARWRGRCA